MPHWLLVFLGLNSASGRSYLLWSGALSDAGILAALVAFYIHHTCHVGGCYWYARRTTAAGERACWKHHPHKRRTAADIHAAHAAAVATDAAQPSPPPADLGAVLAELRGLRADVSGLAETVRGAMLSSKTTQRGRRQA